MIRIYHNPRCSKSRATLALLEEKGVEPDIIRYLETPPSAADVLELSRALGLPVRDFVRRGEDRFRELDLSESDLDDNALAGTVADNPILLERPIVVNGDSAAIGRPPENVLSLLSR